MPAINKLRVDGVQFNLDEVKKFGSLNKFKEAHEMEGFADASYQKVWDEAQALPVAEHVPVVEKAKKPKK